MLSWDIGFKKSHIKFSSQENDANVIITEKRDQNYSMCIVLTKHIPNHLIPGLQEAEVPSIDPLHIDISHFFTDKDKLLLNVTVSNVSIQGLSTLDISTIK